MNSKLAVLSLALPLIFMISCKRKLSSHDEMVEILKVADHRSQNAKNMFSREIKLAHADSLLAMSRSSKEEVYNKYLKANAYLELGQEDKALALFEEIMHTDINMSIKPLWSDLALAYLRQGERSNCISNHAAESCILPVKGMGIHKDQQGSKKAISIFQKLAAMDHDDLESRWLLNIAYMTLGEYPKGVPAKFLIPGMEGDTTYKIIPFQDIAADLKLNVNNSGGGMIVEDFDNDGYLDMMTTGWEATDAMHYFKNNADGTFIDLSGKVGLEGITGGLNMMQTDYNNDGFKDVFVLRGAWKREFGKDPNSLLRNNGNGTFTDVTIEAGLLSYHPTQTATWNDFNNDGWVDLFIGNETVINPLKDPNPCEFYINNHDGTFKEISKLAHCDILNYVKGVTSGDYDHDGWKDIFLSTMDGKRILLRNDGLVKGQVSFTDVTKEAGLANEHGRSFPTWFWDYDNDGWLDIYTCDYSFKRPLSYYTAAEKLGLNEGNPEKMLLYHNNHDGTFTNVARDMGLNTNAFAMGANFGDINNDGYLDIYLGTGNPDYKSVIPNKMFMNLGGKKFADVTASARVGHLQKGHGIAFADMDNDGDQDISIEMGGAYPGDAYQNSFFLNPGQNYNHWINMQLVGTKSNRAAIGTEIKLTFKENGVSRSVYRDVNSGGSFGSSPLRREIGIGQAEVIDELEIKWHGSGLVQIFKDVKPDQFIKITEGSATIEKVNLKKITWTLPDQLCLPTAVAYSPK